MNLANKALFGRLSTGTKMLLILSAAMLPLGFIALLTSLDMARSAAVERRIAAQTTTALYAAQADAVIDSGLSVLRSAMVSTLSPEFLCDAFRRQSHLNASGRPPVALFDGDRRKICQSHGAPITSLAAVDPGIDHVWLDTERRQFRFTVARRDGGLAGESDIPVRAIRLDIADAGGVLPVRLILRQGSSDVVLLDRPRPSDRAIVTLSEPLADGRLALVAEYPESATWPRVVLMVLLPILMWAAAALTGWFVVNRLILEPLGDLRKSIETWQSSRGAFAPPRLTTPSHEIRDLSDSFAAAAASIQHHEHELEEGLARQTKLTREVHHRVKNNLQVVSSLINLHARGAGGEVAEAYSAIQRRVDALAVVHRNHYVELEENRGVSMRALSGELAASLRASAPAKASGMPIALNLIDAYVTQDTAVPVSFLVTEVVELLMHANPEGSVLISLEATDQPNRAKLRIETVGLPAGAIEAYPAIDRFERVVTGIARQFRSPLSQDRETGRFEIEIATC